MSVPTRDCWHNVQQQSITVLESLGKCKTVLQQRHVVLFCSSRCYTFSKLSCHAFPAVYTSFHSPVSPLFTIHLRSSRRLAPHSSATCLCPLSLSLLVSFSLLFPAVWAHVPAARAGEGGTSETRQVPASRACVCYRRCLIVRQDRPFCAALGLIVRKLASNPGFPFRIFSRSFGQNPKQKASVRGNWLTVILYSACAW